MQGSLLSLILDVIPYVVFWKDRRSVYLGVNRNFAQLAGREPADIVGLCDYDLPWTREESDAYRADDREVMESGVPKLHIIETQLTAAGKRTWLDTSKVPLRDAHGEVIGVLGIYADITELKDAEASLKKVRAQLEDAIEAIDAGLVMYDADERLVFCNERYRDIYSERRDLLVPGKSYDEILSAFVAARPDVLGELTARQWVERRLDRHRRCEIWEQVLADRTIRISDRRTRDNGIVSLRTDITVDKQRERELQRAKEAAIAASEAKTTFLANLSHEIRTPMTAILGFADVLVNGDPRPEQLESLVRIQRNAEHLLDLINDILDLSKIEVGKLRVESEPVAVVDLLEDVRALMAVRAEAKGLALTVRVEGRLPQFVRSDATRLRQILVNLVGNAVKFTETGEVAIVAAVGKAADGKDQLRIGVQDTGLGIAPENQERIFEAFEQADASLTRRYGGTGLGLAISRRLARLLGGDVVLESAMGKGSTFTLVHPVPDQIDCEHGCACPPEAPRPRAKVATDAVQLAGRKALLVEDGPDNQRLFAHFLKSMGIEVEVAVDGQDAIDRMAAVGHAAYDVILMDMQMPRVDGYTATRHLRGSGCRVPILALTAHAMSGDRERCLDAGCDDHLTKPLRRAQLAEALAYWFAVDDRDTDRGQG